MTTGEVISLTVVSSGISSVGTVSNILLILAVFLTRQLRERFTAVLLISLSVCDVIICAVYVPMYIYDIHHGPSATFELLRWALGFWLFVASLNGELIVTLDRFIYICYPYRYINLMSKKYLAVATFCTQWFVALSLTLPLLVTRKPLYSCFYIAVVIVVITALNISMYCIARRESKKIARQCTTGFPNQRRIPIWTNSTTTVAMAVMATLLCWSPIIILPAVVPPALPSFKRYVKIAVAFTSLGAAIHPFVFCWKLHYFREALVSCLRKLRNLYCRAVQSG